MVYTFSHFAFSFLVIIIVVWWNWRLNSAYCDCKAGTLMLVAHLHPILLRFFFEDGAGLT
jgi:hypothetical protein